MEILATQLADLLSAVQRSDEKQIRRLLATNVSPHQQNTQGTTALMVANQIGNSKIIKMLYGAMQHKRPSGPLFFSQIVPGFPASVTPKGTLSALVSADFTTRFDTPPVRSETIVKPHDVIPFPSSPGSPNDLLSLSNTTTLSLGELHTSYLEDLLAAVQEDGSEDVADALESAKVLESVKALDAKLPNRLAPKAQTPKAQTSKTQASEAQIALLKTAICDNDFEAVEALLSTGETIRAKNWYDTPLLVIAAEHADGDIVKALLKAGVNVNRGYDRLPLNVASERGNFEIVHILMSAGAYLEAQEENGYTPLMCAAAAGHLLIVQMLVACGADFNVNYYGKTPLTLAAVNGHTKIYDFLYPYTQQQQQQSHSENTLQHQVALAAQHARLEREMFSLFEPDVEAASPQ